MDNSMRYGNIGGIFNLAVILHDDIFENLTEVTFHECFVPKVNATVHLDELSQIFCPNLKYFVVFSSMTCGRGNMGQSNYGMANAIMERIIEKRSEEGLPAKAIQWGPVGDVGLVAGMAKDKISFVMAGTHQQRIASCLRLMDQLVLSSEPVVSSMVVAYKHGLKKLNLIDSVLHIMGIGDIKSISKNSSLAELGMDSLMAIEIQQTLEREFEITLTAQDLRVLTFAKILEFSSTNKETTSEITSPGLDLHDKLFSILGDEKRCMEDVILLNELCNDSSQFNACTLVVPGVEGVLTEKLMELGKLIPSPCYGLQYYSAWQEDKLEKLVSFLYEVSCL